METMMQSAVCLLEQAAEKFKNKTVFEDKDGSISFEGIERKAGHNREVNFIKRA